MLVPLNVLKSYVDKKIRIFLRKEITYTGVLRGFDQHGNLFMADAFQIIEEGCEAGLGTVIINGGTVAMIDIE